MSERKVIKASSNKKKELELEKKKNKERKQTNKYEQFHKNYKENTGTKLISNTKKQKLKI